MPTSVSFDGSGYIYDAFGNIRYLPEKTSTAYYPAASKLGTSSVPGPYDVGFKFITSITINAGYFAIGDTFNVVAPSDNLTIAPGSGVTIRLAGSASTGTLTVAYRAQTGGNGSAQTFTYSATAPYSDPSDGTLS